VFGVGSVIQYILDISRNSNQTLARRTFDIKEFLPGTYKQTLATLPSKDKKENSILTNPPLHPYQM